MAGFTFNRAVGNRVAITLYSDDYNNDPIFELTPEVVFRYDSDGDDAFAPMRRTSVELTMLIKNTGGLMDWLNSNLSVEIEDDFTGKTIFQGYYNGDGMEWDDAAYIKEVKLVFVDVLGILKTKKFEPKVNGMPNHLGVIGTGKALYGFKDDIIPYIKSVTDIRIVKIIGEVKKYNADGSAILTTIGGLTNSPELGLEAAYFTHEIYGMNLYDMLSEICKAFGYYCTGNYQTLYFVSISQRSLLSNINYTEINNLGTITPGTTTMADKQLTAFGSLRNLGVGKRNVVVKADSGLNFELAEGFEQFKKVGIDLFDYTGQTCIKKGSSGTYVFYTAGKDGKSFKFTDSATTNWWSETDYNYWMDHYIKLTHPITSSTSSRTQVKVTLMPEGDFVNQSCVIFFAIVKNYSETGNNTFFKKSTGQWVTTANLWNEAECLYTTNQNAAINLEFLISLAGLSNLDLVIGQAHSTISPYPLKTTMVGSVSLELSAINTTFYEGENLTINNTGANKDKEVEVQHSFITKNTYLNNSYYLYRNAVQYPSPDTANMVVGALFADQLDTTKYQLHEYVGRKIAREYSKNRVNYDVETIVDLASDDGSGEMLRMFDKIFLVKGKRYMALSGDYNLITNELRMSCVQLYQSVEETNNLLSESGNRLIGEQGSILVKE